MAAKEGVEPMPAYGFSSSTTWQRMQWRRAISWPRRGSPVKTGAFSIAATASAGANSGSPPGGKEAMAARPGLLCSQARKASALSRPGDPSGGRRRYQMRPVARSVKTGVPGGSGAISMSAFSPGFARARRIRLLKRKRGKRCFGRPVSASSGGAARMRSGASAQAGRANGRNRAIMANAAMEMSGDRLTCMWPSSHLSG